MHRSLMKCTCSVSVPMFQTPNPAPGSSAAAKGARNTAGYTLDRGDGVPFTLAVAASPSQRRRASCGLRFTAAAAAPTGWTARGPRAHKVRGVSCRGACEALAGCRLVADRKSLSEGL